MAVFVHTQSFDYLYLHFTKQKRQHSLKIAHITKKWDSRLFSFKGRTCRGEAVVAYTIQCHLALVTL